MERIHIFLNFMITLHVNIIINHIKAENLFSLCKSVDTYYEMLISTVFIWNVQAASEGV